MERIWCAVLLVLVLSAALLSGCESRPEGSPMAGDSEPADADAGDIMARLLQWFGGGAAPQDAATPDAIMRQQEGLLAAIEAATRAGWDSTRMAGIMTQQLALQRALEAATRSQWTAQQVERIAQQQQAIQRSLDAAQRTQQDSLRLQTIMLQQQMLQRSLDAIQRTHNIPALANPGAPGVGSPSIPHVGAPGVGSPAIPNPAVTGPRLPGGLGGP